MTSRRNIVITVGFTAALICAGAGPASADLQECFRDGYICSVACGSDKSGVEQCEAQCTEQEKVCVGKVSAVRARPAYSSAPVSTKIGRGGSAR